jgi:hypothetical protein
MKKVISISLSIFLVVWAVVLFSACSSETQATDELISVLHTGDWVGYSVMEMNDNEYIDATYGLGNMTITSDGVMTSTRWGVTDFSKTEYTSGVIEEEKTIIYDEVSESSDRTHIIFSTTVTDEEGGVYKTWGRCYGMLQESIGYTEMRCISIQTLKGGATALDEETVYRTIAKRRSLIQK